MIPRLNISFPFCRQWQYWFGKEYQPMDGEFLLNHARSGIVLALRASLPHGGKVGVVAYNCDTVMNAVFQAGCECVFLDITEELKIDDNNLGAKNLDALVVTNLFGIQNDIDAIRQKCPKTIIIVDNAHGYGLPTEGDFTVYSINQGKYPALGEGGTLVVNNPKYLASIQTQYSDLKTYNALQCLKLFVTMQVKALMYCSGIYGWITKPLKDKKKNKTGQPEEIQLRRMCKGVSRMYNAWLYEHHGEQLVKPFMDIVWTQNQDKTIAEYQAMGIEADVHFKNWPQWASYYGYVAGSCPLAERLIHELVMVPNYYKEEYK